MEDDKLQLKQQSAIRKNLRFFGLLILATGAVLTLIGMVSFFSAFGSHEPPRYFWCAFLGLPLTFVGTVMTFLGYIGAFARYFAGESAPVTKDVVNYMGENTQSGVKSIAKAITQGIKEGLSDSQDKENKV